MQLWPKILVIRISISICEGVFSKQNAIKNHLWASPKLDTLDALMRVSLCNIERPIFEIKTWKKVGFLPWSNCQSFKLKLHLLNEIYMKWKKLVNLSFERQLLKIVYHSGSQKKKLACHKKDILTCQKSTLLSKANL
jgi:hypothetical protein